MSYSLYKVVHLMGVFIILMAMGGAIVLGTANEEVRSRWKKLAMITHGSGLALALLGGFGLLARMGISGMWPGWVFVKVLIWLTLGGAATLALRVPRFSTPLWWGSILLAGIATYLANYKPF